MAVRERERDVVKGEFGWILPDGGKELPGKTLEDGRL
jgi:hypothetical protein